jgi:hypothetical protein
VKLFLNNAMASFL